LPEFQEPLPDGPCDPLKVLSHRSKRRRHLADRTKPLIAPLRKWLGHFAITI